MVEVLRPGIEQELLDDHLGLGVLALAEVVVPDPPLRVGDVDRWPIVIVEGAPDAVVTVDRDRIPDAEGLRVRDDVVELVLEPELRCVDADDRQSVVAVLLGPRPDDTGASSTS